MSLTIDATYEAGVLKLDQPLPFSDRQRVRITVHTELPTASRGYGLLQWTGDPKVLEQVAEDPEFSILDCAP